MTLVEAIEVANFSPEKRTLYLRVILAALLAIFLLSAAQFAGWTQLVRPRGLMDFDSFHLVARLFWSGQIRSAYHLPSLVALQESLLGLKGRMPWTYPPQFALLLAPLAFLPLGMAYLLFTGLSLTAYLALLKRIAGTSFVPVLMVTFPCLLVTIGSGQNGFLTGALIGLACLGFANRRAVTGVPLGLMIIKPHLAIAFALYAIADRRWDVVLTAAATVILSMIVTTAILGFGIWTAFFGGIREASTFLSEGLYPLFRMVSLYASFRSLGVPAAPAMAVQLLSGCLALTAVVWASRHFAQRQALGVAAMASLLVSPYAYDYDMPIFAVGLALLHGDIVHLASTRERLTVYGLIAFSSGVGLLQTFAQTPLPDMPLWALSGLTLFAAASLIFRAVLRSVPGAVPFAFGGFGREDGKTLASHGGDISSL